MIDVPLKENDDQKPPYWQRWPGTALLTCPQGHTARLDHQIHGDGRVAPSVQCFVESCDFHDHARLVGWP